MNALKMFLLACVLSAGSLPTCESASAESGDPSLDALLKANERLERRPLDEPADETFLAWDYALSKNDTPTAVIGVAALWRKNRRTLVELVWWRQRDPIARKAVLLLFYGLTKVEAANFPSFEDYAARFAEPESASRKKEIEEVKTVVAMHSKALSAAFAKSAR